MKTPQTQASVSRDVVSVNDADILACNPFEGDFGETGDRTLSDKLVIARKAGECHLCGKQIKPKERIRRRTDVFQGEIQTSRWCNKCCIAMGKSWTDDGRAYERRAALRR